MAPFPVKETVNIIPSPSILWVRCRSKSAFKGSALRRSQLRMRTLHSVCSLIGNPRGCLAFSANLACHSMSSIKRQKWFPSSSQTGQWKIRRGSAMRACRKRDKNDSLSSIVSIDHMESKGNSGAKRKYSRRNFKQIIFIIFTHMWIFRGNMLAICCCFLPLMCAVMDCSLSVPLPFCFVSPFYREMMACESFYDLLADDKDP